VQVYARKQIARLNFHQYIASLFCESLGFAGRTVVVLNWLIVPCSGVRDGDRASS
jgi:hypothetical protein